MMCAIRWREIYSILREEEEKFWMKNRYNDISKILCMIGFDNFLPVSRHSCANWSLSIGNWYDMIWRAKPTCVARGKKKTIQAAINMGLDSHLLWMSISMGHWLKSHIYVTWIWKWNKNKSQMKTKVIRIQLSFHKLNYGKLMLHIAQYSHSYNTSSTNLRKREKKKHLIISWNNNMWLFGLSSEKWAEWERRKGLQTDDDHFRVR